MVQVFWVMVLVLGIDGTLCLCRRNDPSVRKIHAVFSGIVSMIGAIGTIAVPFILRTALKAEQEAVSYMDDLFVRGILKSFVHFFWLITLLCLLTGVIMLWNGIRRHRKKQELLWCFFGFFLQMITLFFSIGTINAYFDAAIYMNGLFLFEGMLLHIVNTILYFREKRKLI